MNHEQKLHNILKQLTQISTIPLEAVIGFDACIDTIVRPVQSMNADGSVSYFSTIGEFGRHLIAHENLSCAIDIRTVSKRIGGNMPNLANGLTQLGVSVNCIGTLGFPESDNLFKHIGKNLYSVGRTGSCTALQFQDGKIMFSNMSSADTLNFAKLKESLDDELLIQLFCHSDLIAFVNWAELIHSTDLWHGIASSYWFKHAPNKNAILLIDLTDCSKRSNEDVLQVLTLLKKCAAFRKLVFTLNQNEANQLAKVLSIPSADTPSMMSELLHILNANLIVIHRNERCFLQTTDNFYESNGFLVSHPLISVGAGDTFNAALSFGLLHHFPLQELADFACFYAALYVKHGRAFSKNEIIELIQNKFV